MSEEELTEIVIPKNVTAQKRILGFKIRNWIEALICGGIAAYLISLIPFMPKVQAIFTVFISGSIAILNLLGIKGMSISETIINLIISARTKKKYHLRSIRYVTTRKDETNTASFNKTFNESLAEKGVRKAKEILKKHIT